VKETNQHCLLREVNQFNKKPFNYRQSEIVPGVVLVVVIGILIKT
jgi:hypothetical protein